MAETTAHSSPHLNRVHHHRNRVAAARAALDDAAATAAQTHYDQNRPAAPEGQPSDPPSLPVPPVPSAAQ